EAGDVALQARRQLEQERPLVRTEAAGALSEELHLLGAVEQATVVRDAPRCLQHVLQALGRLFAPSCRDLRRGHPVEGVVDLDSVEAHGVPAERSLRRNPPGIERAPPLGIVVARRTDVQAHGCASLPAAGSQDRQPQNGNTPEPYREKLRPEHLEAYS